MHLFEQRSKMSIKTWKKKRLFFFSSTAARFIQHAHPQYWSTYASEALQGGVPHPGADSLPANYSGEIKHFHLIRCEAVRPTQDCRLVIYSTWKRVVVVFINSVRICLTVSTWIDVDIMPLTEWWTMTWVAINCAGCLCYHAFKWSKPFFVIKRKYECTGGWTATATGSWKTRQ